MQYLGYVLMLVALEPAAAIPIAVYMFKGDLLLTVLTP
jgi:NADH dehydrogenase subunit A (EC 1.6.5.3)